MERAVGKNEKLENFCSSWKESSEVGEDFNLNFPTSLVTFQLQPEPSNFNLSNFSFFPTARTNYTYPQKSHQDEFLIYKIFGGSRITLWVGLKIFRKKVWVEPFIIKSFKNRSTVIFENFQFYFKFFLNCPLWSVGSNYLLAQKSWTGWVRWGSKWIEPS